jgi:hypothetical protein
MAGIPTRSFGGVIATGGLDLSSPYNLDLGRVFSKRAGRRPRLGVRVAILLLIFHWLAFRTVA